MQTAHDAKGTAGRELQWPLFLIATAAAKSPPRRQEHLTTAGRGLLVKNSKKALLRHYKNVLNDGM